MRSHIEHGPHPSLYSAPTTVFLCVLTGIIILEDHRPSTFCTGICVVTKHITIMSVVCDIRALLYCTPAAAFVTHIRHWPKRMPWVQCCFRFFAFWWTSKCHYQVICYIPKFGNIWEETEMFWLNFQFRTFSTELYAYQYFLLIDPNLCHDLYWRFIDI